MSLFLIMSMIVMFVIILLRKPILFRLGTHDKVVFMLQNTKWYQNHWIAGGFLFIVNAVLFSGVGLVLYLVMQLSVPFLHIIIMAGAVLSSIVLWTWMNHGWQGNKKDRLKMGLMGSSFYILLGLYCAYRIITLEPSFPGDDTFMEFIGMLFGLIVTSVAFVACMIFTGLAYQKKIER